MKNRAWHLPGSINALNGIFITDIIRERRSKDDESLVHRGRSFCHDYQEYFSTQKSLGKKEAGTRTNTKEMFPKFINITYNYKCFGEYAIISPKHISFF